MLKIDLHMHTKDDKEDQWITYSAQDLIDKAAAKGFNVLAITLHHQFLWKKELVDYAKKRKITLIPASELSIEGKDVLIYNITDEHLKIKTFEQLKQAKEKDKNLFTIAPHPYFPYHVSLQDKLEEHIDLFDAIEISWFHCRLIDFNRKARKMAKKHNKPLVGTSDAHELRNFGDNYTLVNTKTPDQIFKAIQEGKGIPHSLPRSTWFIGIQGCKITLSILKEMIKKVYI